MSPLDPERPPLRRPGEERDPERIDILIEQVRRCGSSTPRNDWAS